MLILRDPPSNSAVEAALTNILGLPVQPTPQPEQTPQPEPAIEPEPEIDPSSSPADDTPPTSGDDNSDADTPVDAEPVPDLVDDPASSPSEDDDTPAEEPATGAPIVGREPTALMLLSFAVAPGLVLLLVGLTVWWPAAAVRRMGLRR